MSTSEIKTDIGIEYWVDITEYVKGVIGNCVGSAKIMLATKYKKDSKEEILHLINNRLSKLEHQYNELMSIQFDECPIIITFINGNTVKLIASELGAIRKID